MLDRIPDSANATILSYTGLPLTLIEAAELASRHAGIIVPTELVSLWPSMEAGFYSVAYKDRRRSAGRTAIGCSTLGPRSASRPTRCG